TKPAPAAAMPDPAQAPNTAQQNQLGTLRQDSWTGHKTQCIQGLTSLGTPKHHSLTGHTSWHSKALTHWGIPLNTAQA
ncbi:Hypothetical predicted protein, partial [Pelobates cultripes]